MPDEMSFSLEAARIKSIPDDAFYIPDFITEDEERYLVQKVGRYKSACVHFYCSQRNITDSSNIDNLRPHPTLDTSLPSPSPNLAVSTHKIQCSHLLPAPVVAGIPDHHAA